MCDAGGSGSGRRHLRIWRWTGLLLENSLSHNPLHLLGQTVGWQGQLHNNLITPSVVTGRWRARIIAPYGWLVPKPPRESLLKRNHSRHGNTPGYFRLPGSVNLSMGGVACGRYSWPAADCTTVIFHASTFILCSCCPTAIHSCRWRCPERLLGWSSVSGNLSPQYKFAVRRGLTLFLFLLPHNSCNLG